MELKPVESKVLDALQKLGQETPYKEVLQETGMSETFGRRVIQSLVRRNYIERTTGKEHYKYFTALYDRNGKPKIPEHRSHTFDKRAHRKCISCRKTFLSSGPEHRRCDSCKSKLEREPAFGLSAAWETMPL